MKKWINAIIIFGMFTMSMSISAKETGVAIKDDAFRKEPFSDASIAGSFKKNDPVEILNKKGSWLQIKHAKGTGWVRLLSVKRNSTSGSSLQGAVNVASGRTGTGKVVATTGVRGLNEEELKSAQFNATELSKLDSYQVDKKNAQSFAKSGGLVAAKISYLKGNPQ